MSISQNYPIVAPSLNLDFSNTKTLDSRITFSRPTGAVYYDGKSVTKAEENLFSYSQEFDNGYWGKYLLSVVANTTTSPDGTSTADEVIIPATNNTHQLYTSVTFIATQYTFSVYAKYSEVQFLQLIGQPAHHCNFDILNGVVGTPSGATASIQDAGNGWYRCSITFTATAMSYTPIFTPVPLLTSTITANYTGNGTSGYYIWGAQLEQRSTATAYQPTTTQPITNYQPTLLSAPADTARFDHDPITGESLGLLVEEQRTNLVTYSEDFSKASWNKISVTLASNTIIAPDGALTGNKIASTSGTWQSGLSTGNISVATSSISVYAKAGEAPILQIATYTYGNFQCYFDLTTGISNGTAGFTRTMTDVGNGWWRCTVSGTLTAGGAFIFIPMAVNSGLNPAPIGQGIYIWGAQLEAGSFTTSYIKTEASQVTRSADNASMVGANFSDWYRQDEGSLFVGFTGYGVFVSMSNSNSGYNQYRAIYKQPYPSPVAAVENYNSANQVAFYNVGGDQPISAYIKVGYSYKFNDFAAVSDGLSTSIDTIGSVATVDRLGIGYDYGTSGSANCHIKRIAYYPQRLSNTQLQALTS